MNAGSELQAAIDALQEARDSLLSAQTANAIGAGRALHVAAEASKSYISVALYSIESASIIGKKIAHERQLNAQRENNRAA